MNRIDSGPDGDNLENIPKVQQLVVGVDDTTFLEDEKPLQVSTLRK
jgi:hypothetical protein|tara:strand:+ start:192 stop:329 length:138 start_codon:yes stop_codon:yes gene_type:complete